ncbi:hypothetical protein F5884DRAFT_755116 [Xylogone sp. PMI_703]|nr:hypothetical protein F5884DRAFT_755116 [Xylogone sp. PMI_703]
MRTFISSLNAIVGLLPLVLPAHSETFMVKAQGNDRTSTITAMPPHCTTTSGVSVQTHSCYTFTETMQPSWSYIQLLLLISTNHSDSANCPIYHCPLQPHRLLPKYDDKLCHGDLRPFADTVVLNQMSDKVQLLQHGELRGKAPI